MCAPVLVMWFWEEQSPHRGEGGALPVACGVCRGGGMRDGGAKLMPCPVSRTIT